MKPCESYSDNELSRIMVEIEKMSDGAPMYNAVSYTHLTLPTIA